eukprot:365019-Chlamydomonas_euryale.AAC.11
MKTDVRKGYTNVSSVSQHAMSPRLKPMPQCSNKQASLVVHSEGICSIPDQAQSQERDVHAAVLDKA